MFFEIFKNLCSTNETTPTTVVKELGLSSSSATSWKQGKVPHHGTLIKIADYFDVSVDYLLGNTPIPTPKEKAPAKAKAADPYEEKLLEDFRACDIEGRMAVLGTAQTERIRTEKKAEGLA